MAKGLAKCIVFLVYYSSTNCSPYSEGDVDVFCEYACPQCVAMRLCSLLHVYCQGAITDSGALVYITRKYSALRDSLATFYGIK